METFGSRHNFEQHKKNEKRVLRSSYVFAAIALLGLIAAQQAHSQENPEYSFVDTHHLSQAWDRGFKGEGSLIVVIDNGRKAEHNVNLVGEACISENPEGSGYYSDCPNGRELDTSFGSAIDSSTDYDGHGQHMMHIAASRGIDGEGRGAAPEASVYSIKISSIDSSGEKGMLLNSLESAVTYTGDFLLAQFPDKKLVMSVSLEMLSNSNSCDNQFPHLHQAIDKAADKGIIFVGSNKPMTAPGCLSHTLKVVPTNLYGERLAEYRPLTRSLAAVGKNVYVDVGGSPAREYQGASVSTALGAGIVADVMAAANTSNNAEVEDLLYYRAFAVDSSQAYLINADIATTKGYYSNLDKTGQHTTTYLPISQTTAR